MPEPVTLILLGTALWAWMRQGPHAVAPGATLATAPAAATAHNTPLTVVAGTGPTAPMATGSSVAVTAQPGQIPADLVGALDAQDALALRQYAALNPDDFQAWLARYSDRITLRNDLMVQAITDPDPAHPIQPTPSMVASMGNAAYKLVQGINGVAAGGSFDVFGTGASVAGAIPGMDPMAIRALQGLALASRAVMSITELSALAAQSGVTLTEVFSGAAVAGAYTGLASIGAAGAVGVLAGSLMAVGLVVDIGFTIAGNAPDAQKAIDVALDAASIAVLFIPVVGIVVAIVIQLVKFIIDLFGGDLFGGGLSHAQREMLETARYAAAINPMYGQLTDAYTPRELFRTIVQWSTGYCGGQHIVAMGINLVLQPGDVIMVGGKPLTITAGMGAPILAPPGTTGVLLGIVDNEVAPMRDSFGVTIGTKGCYNLAGTPFAAMTNDEIAWALGRYASKNGVVAEALVGITEATKAQFNLPADQIIEARAAPMATFIEHGATLDQIDQVALEYRAQPHLHDLAAAFGYQDWQHFFADVVADEWIRFAAGHPHGSLHDFAVLNGYATIYAFRAAALASYEGPWSRAASTSAAFDGVPDQLVIAHQLYLTNKAISVGGAV